ncbi:MAG: hypothetical protein EBS08_02205 [Cytophagia bacterium]|nr:hypothetical protein [Cytophagia bacterium]
MNLDVNDEGQMQVQVSQPSDLAASVEGKSSSATSAKPSRKSKGSSSTAGSDEATDGAPIASDGM